MLLAGCGNRASNKPETLEFPDFPDNTIFMTPAGLERELTSSAPLRILDCSSLPIYRRGHISGAHHAWWQDTIELHNPAYGMLVNPDGRAAFARRAGIEPGMPIICYDNVGGIQAAKVAWTLRYMGIRTVNLLMGGTRGWVAHGRTLSRETRSGEAGTEIEDIFDESIVAHPDDILARAGEPGLVLLDTRTDAELRETWHGRLREGTIPGSVRVPRDRLLTAQDIPIGPDELRRLLTEQIDLDATAEIIVYGLHSGLATLSYYQLLALDQFHVRLYDGSWSQWGSNPDLPAAPLEG